MKKTAFVWVLAILLTLASAVYQRLTGPTYPVKFENEINGYHLSGKLPRSGISTIDQEIKIKITPADSATTVFLQYRKYKYEQKWHQISMTGDKEGGYKGYLPEQDPAGKLEYAISIQKDEQEIYKQDRAIVIRFKGAVPDGFLIPHILFIFMFMIMSNVVAFKILVMKVFDMKHLFVTLGFLILGGFIFGPIVQKYAFGEYWTGFPFGYDLTDNKVLLALLAWGWAAVKRKSGNARLWMLLAALSTLIIFLIPHSVLGSELNYESMEIIQG